MKIKLLSLILIICLTQPSLALTLAFKGSSGSISGTQVNTIKLTNNGSDFNVGDSNFKLPEKQALANAGLNNEATSIIVRCRSDNNSQWSLAVQADAFTLTTDSSVKIPLSNFQWMTTYAGVWDDINQQWIGADSNTLMLRSLQQNSFTPFIGSAQTAYISNSIDNNHLSLNNWDGTEIQIQLGITVPANQQSGTYETSLVFTLTE